MDDELDRFKRLVNLTEMAAARGYQLEPRQRATASSVTMRHPGTDDKIVIRRSSDGHWTYFSVRDDRDNGSVIDFLQRRRALSLGAVRSELRAWLREERPRPAPHLYRRTLAEQQRDQPAVASAYSAAAAAEGQYLLSRGIATATLRDPRFVGCYRVDRRGNILFPHCAPDNPALVVGYEVKNRGFSSFASGGRRTFWSSAVGADDRRLVIVEGSIDALSYHQLFPHERARYLSTGGGVGPDQVALIAKAIAAMPPGSEVVSATDSDQAGEKLHAKLQAAAGVALIRHASPVPKDWNDYLQSLDRKRSLRRQSRLER
jgi:hypothetical protein